MIVLIWLQLIVGTIIIFTIYGQLTNLLQKSLKIDHKSVDAFLLLTTIFLIILYSIIAYYFSKTLDIYYSDKGTSKFITGLTFCILSFLFFSPAKYSENLKLKGQFFWAGLIGLILFSVWRFNPNFGETFFSWIPVYIWK